MRAIMRVAWTMRTRSRSSEHMLKSTLGSTSGSAEFSVTSPVEKELFTHTIVAPMRSPSGCQADLLVGTMNMSPGPHPSTPDE